MLNNRYGPDRRLESVRKMMTEYELDAVLLTSRENGRYLSGFSGTESNLVITGSQAAILVDFRYLVQAADECPACQVIDSTRERLGALAEYLDMNHCQRLGIEEDALSFGMSRKILDLRPSIVLVPAGTWLNDLRSVKDPEEISMIAQAVKIAEKAFLDILRPGLTEMEIASRLEYAMRMLGASGAAFASIVASGPRSAMPHGVASEKHIKAGEAIVMDFGCFWHGYCSDMTRTIFLGEPDHFARHIYAIVLEAQLAALKAVHAGASGSEVDKVARQIIIDTGYGDCFDHGLGHGVGLAVHESPRLSGTVADMLEADQVVSVEPGIYLPGRFGIRIEDLVVVRPGGLTNLNSVSKELTILST
jgi:Xaa-Pro aminopeptidase